jgi:hypothetical protein
MISARVSNIEAFRRWRVDPDQTPQDLVDWITAGEPSEAMLAGTAFHKALELASPGEFGELTAEGYTFHFPDDCSIALPSVRELRCGQHYGDLWVSGQVDALYGKRVEDHKTTGYFNADTYLEGCQWRFYLDIFGADVFRWNVFQVTPVRGKAKTYTVAPPQLLEQVRYPGLHDDCMRLAEGYLDFARKYLSPLKEAA